MDQSQAERKRQIVLYRPVKEHAVRLAAIRRIPWKDVPKSVREARAKLNEARAKLNEACAKWREAYAELDEVRAKWHEAYAKLDEALNRPEMMAYYKSLDLGDIWDAKRKLLRGTIA